jgi:hypothetical protein
VSGQMSQWTRWMGLLGLWGNDMMPPSVVGGERGSSASTMVMSLQLTTPGLRAQMSGGERVRTDKQVWPEQ